MMLFLLEINAIIEHVSAVTEDEICPTMRSTPLKPLSGYLFDVIGLW